MQFLFISFKPPCVIVSDSSLPSFDVRNLRSRAARWPAPGCVWGRGVCVTFLASRPLSTSEKLAGGQGGQGHPLPSP